MKEKKGRRKKATITISKQGVVEKKERKKKTGRKKD